MAVFTSDVVYEQVGGLGLITLNRAKALNALSLPMVRELTHVLMQWQTNPDVHAVLVRGSNKEGPFGAFCAGGDIRYFHVAALAGDPSLEDFFTEEYNLNHLIHSYGKPYIAFMDGVVMGGGMGISQGGALRIVTEKTKMAMPETHIGLFPDVGGGYFLSRCAGYTGEYLALTGQVLKGAQAVQVGLADVYLQAERLPSLWDALRQRSWSKGQDVVNWLRDEAAESTQHALAQLHARPQAEVDAVFGLPTVSDMLQALAGRADDWAVQTLQALRHQSPLMTHVTLEQIRRGRHMTLAQDLRMERDLVRHCFFTAHLSRQGVSSETVEGIRALAVDKDQNPQWQPARLEDVTPDMVRPFFDSPWPEVAHPLRHLA